MTGQWTDDQKNLMLFSGRAHPELDEAVVKELGTELTPMTVHNFTNGEIFVRYEESVHGSDAFVLQAHPAPLNKWLVEQLITIDALKHGSAKHVTAILSFFPYVRQDKKHRGREPISARLVADLLRAAGVDRIVSVDLHTDQIQGFFDGPVDHMHAMPILSEYIKRNYSLDNPVVVSPDAGCVKAFEKWVNTLGDAPLAFIHKIRSVDIANQVVASRVVGEVSGKTCLPIDDMIGTGGTIVGAAKMLREAGAEDVIIITTHGVSFNPARERLSKCDACEVITIDTLPQFIEGWDDLTVLLIAPLLAKTTHEIFEDGSVATPLEGQA